MEPESITAFVKTLVNEDFMIIMTLTFFICEGIFTAWKAIQYKKIASVVVGGVLGYFVEEGVMGVIIGGIAGGATTYVVAKFSNKS